MHRLFIAILILAGTNCWLAAQGTATIGIIEWRSLTSLLDARDVTADENGNLWIATGGGIYVADPRSGMIQAEYRPGEGLLALEFHSIAASEDKQFIFAGATDGTIEMFHSSGQHLHSWTDIRRASDQYPRRTINDLAIRQSRLYAATDFGIVVYDIVRGVPIETADIVANFPPKSAITALAIRNDTLYAASLSGIASIWLGLPSIRDRRQWQRHPLPSGWSWDAAGVGITFDQQHRVTVATQKAILQRRGDTLALLWQRPADWTDPITGVGWWRGNVIFTIGQYFYLLNEDGTITPYGQALPARLNRSRVLDEVLIVGCTAGRGIAIPAPDSVRMIAPNSMLANAAYDLAVDTRGNLWVATASGGRGGSGFAYYDAQQWRTFVPSTDPRVPTVNYYRVAATPSGDIWLSSWGAGLMRAVWKQNDSLTLEYYNNHNSPLVGFSSNPSYTVPGKAIGDQNGTTWIAHWGNWIQNSSHLIARDAAGQFYGFTYPGNPPSVGYLMFIAIDAAGTKWLGSYRADADGSGLVWFNDGGTLADTRDDRWGRITTQGTALPSNTITALATDQTGMLWVGTTGGVAVIVNPTAVLNGGTPFIRSLRELRGVAINAIAVDALNNKWIATSNGIWIIGDDGVTIIGTITQSQYPVMLSNDIRALAYDAEQGLMYIGTERGINILRTIAVRPRPTYQVQIYPQPFDPDRGMLTIDGLAPETELRVSTLSGMTLRTIRTRSRTVLWDGRTDSGEKVPPGIYLLHAMSEQSGESAVAKIVVEGLPSGR